VQHRPTQRTLHAGNQHKTQQRERQGGQQRAASHAVGTRRGRGARTAAGGKGGEGRPSTGEVKRHAQQGLPVQACGEHQHQRHGGHHGHVARGPGLQQFGCAHDQQQRAACCQAAHCTKRRDNSGQQCQRQQHEGRARRQLQLAVAVQPVPGDRPHASGQAPKRNAIRMQHRRTGEACQHQPQ
jgi:hypothetical protein